MSAHRLLVLALALLVGACGGRSPERPGDPAALALELARAARVRVVTDGFQPDARVLDLAHASLAHHHGAQGLALARAAADDAGAPRLVLATVDSPLGRALLERVGGSLLEGGGFEFLGRRFTADLDLLRVALRDPERPGLPLAAWLANRPAALARAAAVCELSTRGRFECYRGGRLVLFGALGGDGPRPEGDLDGLRRAWSEGAVGAHLGLPWRAADARAEALAPELDAVAAWPAALEGWRVVLHADVDAFARVFGRVAHLAVEPTARLVHLLAIDGRLALDPARLAAAVEDHEAAVAGALELPLTDGPARGERPDVDPIGAGVWLPTDRAALASIEPALAELAALGADTVLLRRRVALRADHTPAVARTWRSEARDRSGLHSVDELAHAAGAARAAGLRVAYEPVLLATPTSDLEARTKRGGEGSLAEFEERWAAALEREARVAHLVGAELLVLGSDLPTLTRTRTDLDDGADGWELEVRASLARAWDDGLGRVRATFAGALVYAARDAAEAGRTDLWDALDAVGVQHYPSLFDRGGGRREAGFEGGNRWALERARAVAGARPLVLVGGGVPAAADSASDTRLPRGTLDVGIQVDQLRALASVLASLEPPVAGVLLDEWAVDPVRRGGRGHDLRRAELSDPLRALFRAVRSR